MILYEKLQKMSVAQLNTLKDNIEFIKKSKIKEELLVGAKVYIVQKTKKTLGTITKIMQSRCLVKLIKNDMTYRVPMTMLELQTY